MRFSWLKIASVLAGLAMFVGFVAATRWNRVGLGAAVMIVASVVIAVVILASSKPGDMQ